MSFSDDEVNEFKVEATELLTLAEQALLALETGAEFRAQYDAVFRAFHSVKGAAGMMELTALQACVHQLETHFVSVKDETSLSPDQITYFLNGCDTTRALMDGRLAATLGDFPTKVGQAPLAAPIAAVSQATRERAGRVLVIDDEPAFVEMLGSIFADSGYDVRAFADPREAIKYVISNEVDVVFTDVMMPDMNGVQVLDAVRKIDVEVPVIFVTGGCSREDLIRAIELGVFSVIEKPWRLESILNLAEKAVRLRRLNDLVNASISVLMAQFSSFDQHLKATASHQQRAKLKADVIKLLDERKTLRRAA